MNNTKIWFGFDKFELKSEREQEKKKSIHNFLKEHYSKDIDNIM